MQRRTPATEAIYQEALKNGRRADFVTREAIEEFDHWKIVENGFPYDNIATRSHILVPKRQVAFAVDLNEEEIAELNQLKSTLTYEIIWENLGNARSVMYHYHLHLLDLIKNEHGRN